MKIRSLRELPQSIAPGRDLWPAIEADITAGEGARPGRRTGATARRLSRAGLGAGLAAAACVLLAIGVWIGRGGFGTPSGPGIARLEPPAAVTPVAFGPGATYAEQRALLRRDLAARLAALPPETRVQVEQSLSTLQRSIEELRAALGEDPSNVLLQELLVSAYQDEMRVLVTVQEASRAGQEI